MAKGQPARGIDIGVSSDHFSGGAPVIAGVPDAVVGDEARVAGETVDLNFFRYTNAFNIMDYDTDLDADRADLFFSFTEVPEIDRSAPAGQFGMYWAESDLSVLADREAGTDRQENLDRLLADLETVDPKTLTPEQKLGSLREVAAKRIAAAGPLAAGQPVAIPMRVAVVIEGPLTDEIVKRLGAAGLEMDKNVRQQAKTMGRFTFVLGTIDARKIEDLAKLEAVLRVMLVVKP